MRRDGPNYYPGPGNKVFEMIYQLPKEQNSFKDKLGKPQKIKKSFSFLIGSAIKALPPSPLDLMAFFVNKKKVKKIVIFFLRKPITPLDPLNGTAIKKRFFFAGSLI